MLLRRLVSLLGAILLAAGVLAVPTTASATVPQPFLCRGTFDSPGVLVGTVGDVDVRGFCVVPAGPATVDGSITVEGKSALLAAFGLNDSSLTVTGQVRVRANGVAILGCLPSSFACFDDPDPSNPTLSSHDVVGGDLKASKALGVIVHNTEIAGNVDEYGGGGGVTCDPSGAFAEFGSPAYSDFEDTTIGGSLVVNHVASCWMGFARLDVAGDMAIRNSNFADPDAIEVLSNHISGNLFCHNNTPTMWDSVDTSENLYPRFAEPNTVDGSRIGQCVLASPATDGGPPGPGPF